MCESYYSGDGKEHPSCLKPRQIASGKSDGQCGLYMKSLFNKGVGFDYARGNVERKEALQYIHACIWVRRLCNGVRYIKR
jgi:hypothetical protein